MDNLPFFVVVEYFPKQWAVSRERGCGGGLSRGGRRQTCWAPSEPSVAQQSGPNEVACWAPPHWPYLQLHVVPDEVLLSALLLQLLTNQCKR